MEIPVRIAQSFNGRVRDELLNETLFLGLDHARAKIANWVTDYNHKRPHSALAHQTPAAYAANLAAICDRLRNPDQLRRSHIAPTAPDGVKSAETLIAAGGKFSGKSVKLYSKRWSIEPSFRDSKDLRFGMGMSTLRIDDP